MGGFVVFYLLYLSQLTTFFARDANNRCQASLRSISLAMPLLGQDRRNYGLLQLSDKYDDQDFTEEDETQLTRLAQLTAKTLDAIHRMYIE